MDKKKQPGISFNAIILVEEKFWRKPFLPEKLNIDVEFKSKRTIDKSNNEKGIIEIETFLTLVDSDKEAFVRLETKFVGQFSVIESEQNMEIEHFLKHNAPALIFPYIREHISSVTSRAGISPVILPPMNIVAILNRKRENQLKE